MINIMFGLDLALIYDSSNKFWIFDLGDGSESK